MTDLRIQKLNSLLKLAAHLRSDVKKFTISPKGIWVVTFYGGRQSEVGIVKWNMFSSDTTMQAVTDLMFDPEPPDNQQRTPQIRDEQERVWNTTIGADNEVK